MKVTRRQFLKVSGLTAASFAALDLGFDMQATAAAINEMRTKDITPTPTVCPYCASGCGLIVYAAKEPRSDKTQLLSIKGDPDNPINEGCACPKGSAMFNLREIYDPHSGKQVINPKRVQTPLYRAPGSDKWEEKSWDWMLDRIAANIKKTRDESFLHKETMSDGTEVIVNRTEKIASIGGSGLDNEEAYLLSKMMRSLGVVYLETQARI